ncbi:MAG TPA: alpha-2-macroglobulin family protein [Gemmatales bacterium]|nr:alpha-2-macroglobulin family protein [Gemmatales bacterium]
MIQEPNYELLFDYVFGLLDGNEDADRQQREEVERKLATDPAWQTAWAKVKEQRVLLAQAAKLASSEIVFKPPVSEAATVGKSAEASPPSSAPASEKQAQVEPARTSGAPTTPRRRVVRWWAVAAALLACLALPMGAWYASAARQHDADLAAAQRKVTTAQDTVAIIQKQHAATLTTVTQLRTELAQVEEEVQRLNAEAYQAAAQREFFVEVTRPAHLEAGSPFAFALDVRNFADQPVQPKLSLRIVDEQKQTVVPPDQVAWLNPRPGSFVASLPPDLEVRSDTTWSVEVTAELPGLPPQVYTDRMQLFRSRFVTHVTTDKPMYQPGESVFFRGLALERATLRPVRDELLFDFTITNARGEQVFRETGPAQVLDSATGSPILGPDQQPLRGLGAGSFAVPHDAPGGEYTLTVSEQRGRFPPEVRKFLVNRYEKPRLRKELEFTRKSYGPGDEVAALCRVSAAEGGKPIANQPVQVTLFLDGTMLDAEGQATQTPWTLRTDAAGNVIVKCRLPQAIDRGDATLSVKFTDGGTHEALVRPIPVMVNKVFVQFFPEGGDLVAGVPNRVYFTARTPLDKPAELKARLVDQERQVVAELETFNDDSSPGANQGMGSFTFTPKAENRYFLLVDRPERIAPVWTMPEVKAAGVILAMGPGAVRGKEPWRFEITSVERDRQLLVGLYCRGLQVGQQRLKAAAGQRQEVVVEASALGGVHRVTVFEEVTDEQSTRLHPVAERLVFRAPGEWVQIALQPQRSDYLPGEKVQLGVDVRSESGKPVPAVVMMAVVDKNLLTLADEKTARSMPTHFMLTHELRKPDDLEHADFLVSDHPKALKALDLMLGTQGWRRFAEQDPREFREREGAEAERLLSIQGQTPILQTNRPEQVRRLQERLAESRPVLRPVFERKQASERKLREAEARAATEGRGEALASAEEMLAQAWQQVGQLQEQWHEFKLMFARVAGLAALLLVVMGSLVPAGRGAMRYLKAEEQSLAVLVGGGIIAAVVLIMVGAVAFLLVSGATLGSLPKSAVALGVPAHTAAAQAEAEAGSRSIENFASPGPPGALGAVAADPGDAGEVRTGRGRDSLAVPPPAMPPAPPAQGAVRGSPRPLADSAPPGRSAGPDPMKAGQSPPRVAEAPAPPTEGPPDRNANYADTRRLREPEQPQLRKQTVDRKDTEKLEADAKPEATGRRILPAPVMAPQAPGSGGGGGRGHQGFMVREYAHIRATTTSSARTDFTETVFWHPVLVLTDGRGRMAFDLSDSVTTYQAQAFAHTLDGRLGAAKAEFAAKLPFNIEPKLPVEITAGGGGELPLSVANSPDVARRVHLALALEGLTLEGPPERALDLKAQERRRAVFRLRSNLTAGEASLSFDGRTEPSLSDRVGRALRVVPDGFPITSSYSGTLDGKLDLDVMLPEHWLPGTLQVKAAVYPTVMADLISGLEGMLQEPHGCFEQTSSTNYPNTLVLRYLQESDRSQPEVMGRARDLLARGYDKLLAFECIDPQSQRRGYEWFGGRAAPHEALTAYGLMQFRDMAAVMRVDAEMLARTERFLLAQRDGQGGFRRNPKALDGFGRGPEVITNAYILWSLSEAGVDADLSAEAAAVYAAAAQSPDAYLVALAANVALNLQQAETARALVHRLASLQQANGSLVGTTTSITGSGGRDLAIETTALTILAWLKAKDLSLHEPNSKAMRWLLTQRGGQGAFGSTQATVLALKALVSYAKEFRRQAADGDLVIEVAGTEIGRMRFTAEQTTPIELHPACEQLLRPGRNRVTLALTGGNVFPYSFQCSYRTVQPSSAADCAVRLDARLDRDKVKEGDTVRLMVKVANVSGKGQGMTVAIIGLPAGLTLPEDAKQLRDYTRLLDDDTRPGRIAAWEIIGRELVLYWRDLAPEAKIELPIDLVARVPGTYRGPASRAYLYYNADAKHWIAPLAVTIRPE